MSKKDTKKQRTTKPLDGDALENVSGGYSLEGRLEDGSFGRNIVLTDAEAAWLGKHGYTFYDYCAFGKRKRCGEKTSCRHYKEIQDACGNELSPKEVAALLDANGFSSY